MEQIINKQLVGKTVAAVVRVMSPETPWSKVRKWCKAGRVSVDGEVVRDHAVRVVAGTVVSLGRPQRDTRADVPVLAVDHEIVVVDKPAGLVTVPFIARGEVRAAAGDDDTLRHRVHSQLRARFGSVPPPRVVQRLDRETSGVMVFARTRRAERELQQQLRAHDVDREYLALCWGQVSRGTHDTWLVADRGDRRRGTHHGSGRPPPGSKRAITHVQPLELFEKSGVTLVMCRLETGRQHQIRIHLAEAGHPLLGERVYLGPLQLDRRAWSKDHEEPLARLGVTRTLLHAQRLGIRHPASGEAVVFTVEPPPEFAAVLTALRTAEREPRSPVPT